MSEEFLSIDALLYFRNRPSSVHHALCLCANASRASAKLSITRLVVFYPPCVPRPDAPSRVLLVEELQLPKQSNGTSFARATNRPNDGTLVYLAAFFARRFSILHHTACSVSQEFREALCRTGLTSGSSPPFAPAEGGCHTVNGAVDELTACVWCLTAGNLQQQ